MSLQEVNLCQVNHMECMFWIHGRGFLILLNVSKTNIACQEKGTESKLGRPSSSSTEHSSKLMN